MTYREETVGGVPGIWCLPGRRGRLPGPALHPRRRIRRRLGVQPPQARGALRQGARRAFLRPRLPPGPRAPAPGQLEDAVSAFLALTERGIAPGDITTIGDSAGGNLAVAIPWRSRERGQPRPGSVIALSPWLDMENTGETLVTNEATDALVTVRAARGHDRRRTRRGADRPDDSAGQPAVRRLLRLPAALRQRRRWRSRCSTTPPGVAEQAQAAGVDVTLSVVDGHAARLPVHAPAAPPRRTTRSPPSPRGTPAERHRPQPASSSNVRRNHEYLDHDRGQRRRCPPDPTSTPSSSAPASAASTCCTSCATSSA